MFCVECGKEEEIFKDGVCIDCYLKSHTFTKGPEIIDLPICSHCNSFKYKNTWTTDILGEVLRRIIKNTFKISKELNKVDINTECKETKGGLDCKVYITGLIDNKEITEVNNLFVRLNRTVCEVCSRRFGGYHEAIVQVRTEEKKLTKDEISKINIFVENFVEELYNKGNRGLFITDMGEERGGIDFYISEKGPALAIAKKIQEQFGGTIKQSSKNVGMKDSKQVYKMTYSVRLTGYKKGSFLELSKTIFYVTSTHGNKVKMLNLTTWDESLFDVNEIKAAKILGGTELVKDMIFVSQTDNDVQVMDPETYKIQTINKPKKINFKSEKVKALIVENNNLLIPNNNG